MRCHFSLRSSHVSVPSSAESPIADVGTLIQNHMILIETRQRIRYL
jgi:hypothetical protein